MRAFVVRPFGVQEGIDFDRIQKELIEPALARLRALGVAVDGGTTGEISRAGNIREDMFRLIAISDLVIADVTIHNANAFYELGVRHALRPEHTHMIRAKNSKFKYPFDLQTDRYYQYELEKLEDDVEPFAQALRATLAGERDSPIFNLLKDLSPHERGALVKVPGDFREDVGRAQRSERRGDLRLLAHECTSFDWDQEGLAMVGNAQNSLRDYEGARDTFELLRVASPNQYLANWRLGTIYQRLATAANDAQKEDLTTSSEDAIKRALDVEERPDRQAELNALLGSNAKNRWIADCTSDDAAQRGLRALASPCLERMLEYYMRATGFDLNSHYPAVNVLSFLKAQTQLARRFPETWAAQHDADPEAELRRREELAERIRVNLQLSLRRDPLFKGFQSPPDPWSASSIADLTLISDPAKTAVIGNRYLEANSGATRFELEANRRNLDIFKALDLFEPGVSAALAVIESETRKRPPPPHTPKRTLLFTGHMVDAAGRAPEKARFPRTPEAERTARQLILEAVKKEVGAEAADTVGIAGGACGGDILFHEVCAELRIKTELFLVLPVALFKRESVERGGEQWVARYEALCQEKQPRLLQSSLALPNWLAGRKDYSIWERNNLWMMFNALTTGATSRTLVALFNEEREPDGPGGTKHLLSIAREHGLRAVHVDAKPLLTQEAKTSTDG